MPAAVLCGERFATKFPSGKQKHIVARRKINFIFIEFGDGPDSELFLYELKPTP